MCKFPLNTYVKKYIKHFFSKIVQFASFCLIKSDISKKRLSGSMSDRGPDFTLKFWIYILAKKFKKC